jgi:hypothetical protein
MRKYLFLLLLPALIFSNQTDLKKIEFNDSGSFYPRKGTTYIDISTSYIPFYGYEENKVDLTPYATFSFSKQTAFKKNKKSISEMGIEICPWIYGYVYHMEPDYVYSIEDHFYSTCSELKYQKLYFSSPNKNFSSYYGGGLGVGYPRFIPAYLTYGLEWNKNSKNPSRLNFCLSSSLPFLILESQPDYKGGGRLGLSKYFFSSVTTSLKVGYGFGF